VIAGEITQRSAKLPRTDNIALFFDLLGALLSTPRTLPAVKGNLRLLLGINVW
jgi:hypothetical protein